MPDGAESIDSNGTLDRSLELSHTRNGTFALLNGVHRVLDSCRSSGQVFGSSANLLIHLVSHAISIESSDQFRLDEVHVGISLSFG